jgi:hypothetical protein
MRVRPHCATFGMRDGWPVGGFGLCEASVGDDDGKVEVHSFQRAPVAIIELNLSTLIKMR